MVDKFSAQTLKPTLQLFLLLGSHAVDGDKPPSSIRSEMTTGSIYFTWLDPSDHLVILLPPAGLGALEVASHQLQLLVAADLRHLEADNSPGQGPLEGRAAESY